MSEYLERLRGSLDGAAAAAGGFVERDLELADVPVRLRFAGSAMADVLMPPFEHLATEDGAAPELTIGVYDAESTGVGAPPLPFLPVEPEPGTNPVTRFESDGVSILASGAGTLTAADPGAGEAIFHLTRPAAVPSNERAAPLREALHLLMAPRGLLMTHAGAVGAGGRGVLLVGGSGSGKSTLSLACALAGMELVADDYLLLETGPPVAHALQSTVKLTEDSAARLGLTPEPIEPAAFESTMEGPAKALVDVISLAPGAMRRRLEVAAIVAPSVAGLAAPEIEPVSAGRGLRALAPSTVLQLRSRNERMLASLGGLVREAPSFELRLSSDPAANAATISVLVDRLG